MIDLAKNKDEFIGLVEKYIKRDGIENLMGWLDRTDFYTAPATTGYQLSVDGGLVQHSLNTFYRMVELANMYYGKEPAEDNFYNGDTPDADSAFTMESIALVALFHSIYKADVYVKDFRNQKINGKWEQVEYYRWDEAFVYGRGAKSVYILQQFMRLYTDEAQAIRFHTAGREDANSGIFDASFYRVYEKSPISVLLFMAEQMAYWLDSKEV